MGCWSCPDEVKCDIDHCDKDMIVCPYCGEADTEPDVFSETTFYHDVCIWCGKDFTVQKRYTWAYTTRRIKKKEK